MKKLTSKQRARIVRGLEALALYIGNEEFDISHLVGHVEPQWEDEDNAHEVVTGATMPSGEFIPGPASSRMNTRSAAWLVFRVEGQADVIDALDINGLAQLEQRSYTMTKFEMVDQMLDAVSKLGQVIDKGTNA